MKVIAEDKLDDVDNPEGNSLDIKILRGTYGLLLNVNGFTDRTSEDGEVVLIENRD